MKSKRTRKSTRVLKPNEFATLLHTAPPEILPTIVLSGFSALRLGDILPLDWSAINLRKKKVAAFCHKLHSHHLAPLPDAAIAWLAPIAMKSGRVADYSTRDDLRAAMQQLWQAAGIKWVPDHLRFSVLTYVMSTAPKVIDTVKGSSKDDAEHWFSIFPTSAG